MASVQDSIRGEAVPLRWTTVRDPMLWAFVAALLLLFWLPELVFAMGWAKFWIQFTTQVFIWSLFAVSFNLLMGYTGMVSFGQAAYLGIGGYTAGLLLKNIAGFPFWLGLVMAPVGGALAALVIGYFCVRRTHIYLAILTLALTHCSETAYCQNATILETENIVQTSIGGKGGWAAATSAQSLAIGDRIRTRQRSRATLRLTDLYTMRLEQFTTVEIAAGLFEAKRRFRRTHWQTTPPGNLPDWALPDVFRRAPASFS